MLVSILPRQFRHNLIRHNLIRHNLIRHNLIRHNLIRHNLIRHNLIRHNLIRHNLIRHNLIRHNLIRHNLIRHNLIRHNLIRHNLIRHNLIRHNLKLLRLSLIPFLGFYISACSTLPSTIPATPEPVIKTPTVALVLGGGGAKGFAHVGVIKALEENGIKPTLVVGTSVGSLIGSLYASGYTPAQLEQLALNTTDSQLTDFTLSNQGFIEGIKLKNFINSKVNARAIEDFPIAFAAIAAEKHTLKKIVFTTGDAGLAVQASCSVPNIFIAPRIPEKVGKKYIDGGVVSLVPVDSAYDLGADIVIAVDVTGSQGSDNTNNQIPTINSLSDFWGLLETNILATNLTANRSVSSQNERDRADIVITPNVGHNSSIDTRQRRSLIQAGAQATTPQINAIKQLIQEKSSSKYATL